MHNVGIITMWSQENLRQYFDDFSKTPPPGEGETEDGGTF